MAITDLYSKRHGEQPDTYIYDDIPQALRIQINFIVQDFLKKNNLNYAKEKFSKTIFEILTREHCVEELRPVGWGGRMEIGSQIKEYLIAEQDLKRVLDIIEIQFRCIEKISVFVSGTPENVHAFTPKDAVSDLNTRFKEHAVGYRFEQGRIIKITNELLHSEIATPVFSYLLNQDYATINDEFMEAYKEYKKGNFKACLNECTKAIETTLKVICDKRGWQYGPKDTASKLIALVFEKKLIPDYLQTQITSLRATLESGATTIRNKNSAHGQGSTKITVEEHFASYTLNLTGSSIKFLIELHENGAK